MHCMLCSVPVINKCNIISVVAPVVLHLYECGLNKLLLLTSFLSKSRHYWHLLRHRARQLPSVFRPHAGRLSCRLTASRNRAEERPLLWSDLLSVSQSRNAQRTVLPLSSAWTYVHMRNIVTLTINYMAWGARLSVRWLFTSCNQWQKARLAYVKNILPNNLASELHYS